MRLVDSHLAAADGMTTSEKNDARFIVAADIVRKALDYAPSAAEHVLGLGDPDAVFTDAEVSNSLKDLRLAFDAEMKAQGTTRDRLAKSGTFVSGFLGRQRA
jgi:hypothetical protein